VSGLDELLRDLPVRQVAGSATGVAVTGLAHDSRRVVPGDLFAAWSGAKFRGRDHAAEALTRGAVAVLCDEEPAPGSPAAASASAPWFVAAEPRRLLAPLGARLYRRPDRELDLVGVTGTNGKTTTVTLVAALLEAAGRPAGVLGTLGYRFRDQDLGTDRTTPEASDLFRILRALRELGAVAAAMEVSSHALEQGRVEGVEYRVGVFTNLTRDHFDFHGDFASYFRAKRRLFEQLAPEGRACVNVDDPYGRELHGQLGGSLGFGVDGDVRPEGIQLDERGMRGTILTPRGPLRFESTLLGRYNLDNVLAAVAVGEALGLPHEAMRAGLRDRGPLPGRLEPVAAGQEFPALVDYAHTDAALIAALTSVREFTRRKILLVFGCGGDRDPGKRPLMGAAAGRLADLPIITSDNPRTEDPQRIVDAVEAGLKATGHQGYRVVLDRHRAIEQAVAVALEQPGEWILVVAGKGHETAQLVGDQRLPFSDRAEIARAVEQLRGAA
jgi:UDP-N-acetylmuramoyl-L-alanyl-D-glutamate--2,6-diaminopimelate ligase